MKAITHLLGLALLTPAAFFIAGCNTSTTAQSYEMAETGQNVFTVPVPEGVSAAQVQQAIEFSLTNREWTIVESEDGSIDATLSHREISAQLDISYDDDSVRIVSNATDADGRPLVPLRWIEFLQGDIERQLQSAAM